MFGMSPVAKNAVALGCTKCHQPLGTDVVFGNGSLWHTACASCFNCKKPVRKSKIFLKANSTFCSKCYKQMYRQRCIGCQRPFKEITALVKAMDVKWHPKCFRCCICRKALKEYSIMNNRPICEDCLSDERFSSSTLVRDLLTLRSPSSNRDVITPRRHMEEDDGDGSDEEPD